jgi:hypothetical protein
MFHIKAYKNKPNLVLLAWKYTIWQPCRRHPKKTATTAQPVFLPNLTWFATRFIRYKRENQDPTKLGKKNFE